MRKKCRCKTINVTNNFNDFGFNKVSPIVSDDALLLNSYPGAKVAYSIRLLDNTYTSALMEIERASDNATLSFLPDSNGVLSNNSQDTGGTTTLGVWGTGNCFVKTWYDQSGNGNDISQSFGNQPYIIQGGVLVTKNGFTCVHFDSGVRFLTISLAIMQDEFLSTCVNMAETDEVIGGIYESVDISLTNRRIIQYSDTRDANKVGCNYAPDATGRVLNDLVVDAINTYYIDTMTKVGNNHTGFKNGTQQATQDVSGVSTATLDTLVLGKQTLSSLDFVGWLPELVIWDSDNSSNRAGIESNINTFYSIY